MTDRILEQVSAFADDELDAREASMLLARMQRDEKLRDAWEHYHLVGEAMRRALPATRNRDDLAARVAARIEQEEQLAGRGHRATRLAAQLKPVAGLAVAASVAMLAVFTLQAPDGIAPSEVVPMVGNQPVAVPMIGPSRVDFSGVRSPELQDQLRSFLLNHSEHSTGPKLRGGMMPYVQIAAQDTRPVEAAETPADESEPRRK